jgi:hypothetical protein
VQLAEATAEELAALEEKLREALHPNYVLVRRLGTGGMGSVFLAREPVLKRLVAVKVLAPELAADPNARLRFEREAQAVAGLSHPNIVSIYTVGQLDDGTPYFAMQYVQGRSLAARLASDGPLDTQQTRRVVGEVAAALAAAHAKGVIHRDIKPANVLHDEELDRVLVSDFGIAAVLPSSDAPAPTKLTATGIMVGTPQYMSPEQILAEKVTEKTDVYSLGLLAYEALVGKGPFDATSPQELVAAHLRDVPKRLSDAVEHVDPEFDALIASCLDKDPATRPTAQQVAARLGSREGAVLEWPPPGLERLRGRAKRVGRLLWFASLVCAAAVLLVYQFGIAAPVILEPVDSVLLGLLAAAGLGTLVAASGELLHLAVAASRAVQLGFGWFTVAEVIADERGDTHRVISGLREYAGLSVAQRTALRRRRVMGQACLLVGGLLPPLMVIVASWLGALGIGGELAMVVILLGPSVGLLFVRSRLAGAEAKLVQDARARYVRLKGGRMVGVADVDAWHRTYDEDPGGRTVGVGSRSRRGVVVVTGVAVAGLIGALIIIPVIFIGLVGPFAWGGYTPMMGSTLEKLTIADVARPYAVPVDSSIDPLEAGEAYYTLATIAGPEFRGSGLPEKPIPHDLTLPVIEPYPQGTFAEIGAFNLDQKLPNILEILAAAQRGFSEQELAYLERVDQHPVWSLYRTVARAPDIDYLGARFDLPFPDSISMAVLPIPRFADTKGLAHASVMRAAYHLALGDPDRAEEILRETISFGFRMIDSRDWLIEALVGIVVVGIGRSHLIEFYTLEGRSEGAQLRAAHDSALALVDAYTSAAARRTDRWGLIRWVQDDSLPRSFRLEPLSYLMLVPCSNIEELLLGPRADVEEAFEAARADLVRFPSDEALMTLVRETSERYEGWRSPGLAGRGAKIAGWILGNRRVRGCVDFTLGAVR